MKKLYIVSGANGSGKTTFAKMLTEDLSLPFVNADEIAKELDPSNTTGGKMEAGRVFFQQVRHFIKEEQSFVLESTLSGKYLEKLIPKVQAQGFDVELIYIFLENPDVCIERIKERVLNGGHHVPDDDVVRRYYRSKNNFWNVYKEMVNQWFLVYNSDLRFKEFCIGVKDQYDINDADIFNQFIEGVENGK